jgi:hypothetical protein
MEIPRSENRTVGMLSTLGPKKVTKVRIWKVRTLYESGKIQQLETEMDSIKWIGHTVRKDQNAVERIQLDWNPQGTRKRGKQKKTWKWHREREKEGRGGR